MKFYSFYSKPLSLIITKILFFLSVVALTLTQAKDDKQYTECSKEFICGSKAYTDIKYPFWGGQRSSNCGVHEYEVKCEGNDTHPVFEIGSQAFDVLSINRSTRIMTIVRVDLLGGVCTNDIDDTFLDKSPDIHYERSTQNITFFYSCQGDVMADVNENNTFSCGSIHGLSSDGSDDIWLLATQECNKNITIPVMKENFEKFIVGNLSLPELIWMGFEVVYELQTETLDLCKNCEYSGGICANTTKQFTCLCKDGPQIESCPKKSSNSTVGRNIGIGVSSVLLLLVIVVGCLYKAVEKVNYRRRKEKHFKSNGGLLLQQQLSSDDNNIKKINIFKSYELEKATNNYNVDRVLGQGGQGIVYKGILSDGKLAAIKKSKNVDTKDLGQFLNEVAILSQINHRNIVRLLGCCLETEVPILVYEFISNGTLDEQLHNSKEDIILNWKMRLQIAAETASTLSYLHNAVPKPIYHRDIKSSNILLDDKFKAKVADFGISRSVEIDVSHLTTLVRGTFGYLDPEYYHSCRFTEKSDVYSFGVVLVELLTGQKPIFSDTFGELKGLAPYFMGLMEENDFLKMIDPRLSQEDNAEEMIEVAYIAKACLDPIGKRRPTMKEVMVRLEGIKMSRKQSTHQENGKIDVGEAYDDSSSEMETWEESSTTSSRVVETTT